MMIGKFFSGLPLMGYALVGAATLLLTSLITIGYLNHKNNKLHEQLGNATQAIELMLDVNSDNQNTIEQLDNSLRECVDLRRSADVAIDKARTTVGAATREALDEQDSREDHLQKIMDTSPDPVPATVPSSATRLLIEAACSANRGKSCD